MYRVIYALITALFLYFIGVFFYDRYEVARNQENIELTQAYLKEDYQINKHDISAIRYSLDLLEKQKYEDVFSFLYEKNFKTVFTQNLRIIILAIAYIEDNNICNKDVVLHMVQTDLSYLEISKILLSLIDGVKINSDNMTIIHTLLNNREITNVNT